MTAGVAEVPEPLRDVSLPGPTLTRIEARELSVFYGRLEALHRCSLTVSAGEAVALLGPNGAGKSTLLAVMATLMRPSEGKVVYDERWGSVRHRQRVRPHIGLVAHDSLLYHELSGRENLVFYAKLYGGDVPSRVEPWLERVGLTDAADRTVSEYSRGMRQRLSIARAMIHQPSIVLFDEPLTGLDRDAQAFVWGVTRWLRREKRTTILVTHHFDAPEEAVDRVVVMQRGRIRANVGYAGSLAGIYEKSLAHGRR